MDTKWWHPNLRRVNKQNIRDVGRSSWLIGFARRIITRPIAIFLWKTGEVSRRIHAMCTAPQRADAAVHTAGLLHRLVRTGLLKEHPPLTRARRWTLRRRVPMSWDGCCWLVTLLNNILYHYYLYSQTRKRNRKGRHVTHQRYTLKNPFFLLILM